MPGTWAATFVAAWIACVEFVPYLTVHASC